MSAPPPTPITLGPTRSHRTGPTTVDAGPTTATIGRQAELLVFESLLGTHLFVTDGSRIYDLPPGVAAIDNLAEVEQALIQDLQGIQGPHGSGRRYITGPMAPPPLSSLSLNLMQACNMTCGYCYADEGRFGGPPRRMSLPVARAAVDRLIAESAPGANLVLGFMGGEPLLNRGVLHDTTRHAARAATDAGHAIRFSLTTNLTLLRQEDAELFSEFPFTVAVSIDGERDRNDGVRRMNDGSSAYDRVLRGLEILRRHGRPRHLAARATVTPRTGELVSLLDHLIGLDFDEVGFAAVVVSPDPSLAFGPAEFDGFLEQMVACGERALAELRAGRPYPFGNLETALAQIHRGSHRPYPCGAGAAYLSANSDGALFACHRLVDDPRFAMGHVHSGLDGAARAEHLSVSHVDRMQPCRSCWARYLCGGGCYHEVTRRGRPGCDYIRGWLQFCLRTYVELSESHPELFRQRHDLGDGTAMSTATALSL